MTRVWSEKQLVCLGDAATGKGNRIIKAVAGSGKTTTGVEMVKRVRGSHIYLAFNKAIATELASRGVNGRTFHSVCYTPVTRARNCPSVDMDKMRKLVDAKFKGEDARIYGSFAQRLVGLAKNCGVGVPGMVPDLDACWYDIVSLHDLELDDEGGDIGKGVELAQMLLKESNESRSCDFDDLLYFAVKDGIPLAKFDNVFVDEAQDTNAIQRALIRKMMKDTARLFAIGDPAQAIYGFRGADSSAMAQIREEFDCTELPLDITYRCAQSIVTYAHTWVDHIIAAPGAPEGEVKRMHKWDAHSFDIGNLVVCRTTAPLIKLGFKMLKARVPVHIMGREIGKGLHSLIKRLRAKDVDQLVIKLDAWAEREAEKAFAVGKDQKAESIRDKADAIKNLIEGLNEDMRTIEALNNVIEDLFADQQNVVTLATIHKSKGLEADTVFWLNSSKCPSPWARQDWQKQQEANLCYVATTRAKTKLVLIEEPQE